MNILFFIYKNITLVGFYLIKEWCNCDTNLENFLRKRRNLEKGKRF